jgi:hypothetical protein
MDNQDTKILIISELSHNIDDLINIITVDKSTYNLFSRNSVWSIIFLKHDLPLFDINYDDPSEWLVLFKKELKLKIYTNRLMDILEHTKHEDFKQMDGIHGLYIDNELSICYKDISFIHILNVEGINMKEIYKISNKCILNKLDKIIEEDVGFTTCSMYIEKEKYVISIDSPSLYHDNINKYYINRDNMKKIFYNILSYGVIPVNQFTGNKVQLNPLGTSYYEARIVEYSGNNFNINHDF